jgi:hypothetical protein
VAYAFHPSYHAFLEALLLLFFRRVLFDFFVRSMFVIHFAKHGIDPTWSIQKEDWTQANGPIGETDTIRCDAKYVEESNVDVRLKSKWNSSPHPIDDFEKYEAIVLATFVVAELYRENEDVEVAMSIHSDTQQVDTLLVGMYELQ